MTLQQMRYLIAVADLASFTRAAAELHISQPALSQQIRHLESALGVQLLDRSGKGVKPTDAGRVYIAHVRRVLRDLDAAQRAVRDVEGLAGGVLRLGFLPLFTTNLVGRLVQAFHARHSGVALFVEIHSQAAMEDALASDRIDIGVGFSDVKSDEIVVTPFREEELCLVVGEGHPAFGREHLAVKELEGVDLALLNAAFVTRPPVDLYLQTNFVRPRIAVECNSVDSLVAIVRGSRLATVLPQSSARNISGLSAIRMRPPIGTRTISALLRNGAYRSAATEAFVRLMSDWDWSA